jgi:hypothetical protein
MALLIELGRAITLGMKTYPRLPGIIAADFCQSLIAASSMQYLRRG